MSSFGEPLLSWFLHIYYDTALTKIPKILGTELKRRFKRQLPAGIAILILTESRLNTHLWQGPSTILHTCMFPSPSGNAELGAWIFQLLLPGLWPQERSNGLKLGHFSLPYFIHLATCCYIKCNLKYGASLDDFTVLEPPKSFDVEDN